MNSSMQPDLTVSRTYTGPICFPDSMEKELIPEPALFDPLPDLKVKVHSSFMVSLGVSERAEYHAKAPSQTFPRGVVQEIGGGGGTLGGRGKSQLAPVQPALVSSMMTGKRPLRTSGVFGHGGGRLVVPNTGVCLMHSVERLKKRERIKQQTAVEYWIVLVHSPFTENLMPI